MASLPAIVESIFKEKVLEEKPESTRPGSKCSTCQKVFDGTKAYQNHLKSRNHLEKLAATVEDDVAEDKIVDDVQQLATVASRMENLKIEESSSEEEHEEDNDEVEDFDEEICLFCLHDSEGLDENVAHMQKSHGLFIPNQANLTDLASFLNYLHTLIAQFHECLYCGTSRNSAEGARAHMRSKGHCMVNLDSDELGEFWEDAAGEKGQIEMKSDEEKMALPGGKVVARRDQARRYRQHLPSVEIRAQRRAIAAAESEDVSTESGEPSSSASAAAAANQERSLTTRVPKTEMGLIGLSDVEKRSLRVVEKHMLKIEMRARNEYRAGLERRGNAQRHFKVSKTRTLILPPSTGR
jgi:pre-60S factor REI1